MAMKFWFGKKDDSTGEAGKVSCDVLALPDPAEEKKAPASPLFGVAQMGSAVVAASAEPQGVKGLGPQTGSVSEVLKPVGVSAAVPLASEAVRAAEQKPVLRPVAEKTAVPLSAPSPKAAAPSEAAKLTLRPVGAPVRLAAPAPESGGEKSPAAPVASSAAAAPAASDGHGTAKTLAFGFRLKSKTAVVSAAPAPAPAAPVPAAPAPTAAGTAQPPEKADAKVADPSLVRPKTDQRALYYELMNGFYDAVLILDDQGHVVDSNNRVMTVLGYTREDMWDMPIDKVITGMTSQMFEHLRRNLAENHHVLIDARCFRQDGTAFAGEVGVSQLSLTRGGNLVFVIRNVDRRKTAMEELRKGQAAMQVSLAPTFVCDLDGFFQIVNQALLEAFGIPDEKQAKSVRFVDLLPDAARYFLRASCGEKLRETVSIATPDGGSVKVDLVLSPVQNGQTVTAVTGSLLQQ